MNPTAQDWWKAGCYALAHEEDRVAIRCFEAAQSMGWNTPEIWNNLGCIWAKLAEWDRAGWAFRQALQLDPSSPMVWANYGRMYLRMKDFRQAIHAFSRIAAPRPPEIDLAEAYAWLHLQKPEAALQLLEAIPGESDEVSLKMTAQALLQAAALEELFELLDTRLRSDSPVSLQLLHASLLLTSGEAERSLEILTQKKDLFRSRPRAAYLRLLAGLLCGPTPAWQRELETEAELTFEERCSLLAWLSLANDKPEEAYQHWIALRDQEPDNLRAWWGMAQSALLAGKTEESDILLTTLLDKFPDHPDALWLKAGSGTRKEKGMLLDRLLKIRPNFVPALFERGQLWLLKGLPDQAVIDFQKATNLSRRAYQPRLGLAMALVHAGKNETAWAQFCSLATDFPEHPDVQWNVLVASVLAKKWTTAIDASEKVLAQHPQESLVWSLRGEAFFRKGATRAAGEAWEMARSLDKKQVRMPGGSADAQGKYPPGD